MTTINAHFDGRAIVPDELVDLATDQKLRIRIELVPDAPAEAAPSETQDKKDWQSFLGLGKRDPRRTETDDELWGDI